jgi:hypothetical protein
MTKELKKRIQEIMKADRRQIREEKRIKSGFYQKLSAILLIIMLIGFSVAVWRLNALYEDLIEEYKNIPKQTESRLEANFEPLVTSVEPTTKELIEIMAKEYNVCVETALKIAECESQFGKYNHNWEGSSAKGVFMFTDRTWNYYCRGDVLNEEDNIRCFMEIFNNFPQWWACNK